MAAEPPAAPSGDEGRPPLFRTWGGLYAFVLGVLAAVIAAGAVVSAVFQ
jgi:hypothetical protein